MIEQREAKKLVIGLYGEMRLSMRLHELGWQVHRAYIDEGIDFTITKYWCSHCKCYAKQWIRKQNFNSKAYKCVTNLCSKCHKTELDVVSRYLQIKTSEGIATQDDNIRKFSFHPKIRYDMGNNIFYVWIAVFNYKYDKQCHFYILNTKDVSLFDNIKLPTYQITDNQKTELRIRNDGVVIKKSQKYSYDIFNDKFYENWNILEDNTKS